MKQNKLYKEFISWNCAIQNNKPETRWMGHIASDKIHPVTK